MTIVHPLDPTAIRLDKGSHPPNTDQQWCVMEAAAWMAGEEWSDRPQCVSPVLSTFLMTWNDGLPDDDRQMLTRYLAPAPEGVIGTVGLAEVESVRAWMAADWLVRVHTPAWLRLAGLTEHADRLAALPELTRAGQVPSIKPALEAARSDARAAWEAAWEAAWAAARAAAGEAAGEAAWEAAREALQPTVTELQTSAHDLIGRMIRAEAKA